MYSRRELAEGFRGAGVSPGDVILLHASVRAVGPVAGGPDQIHLALKDALGSGGTLMMYAGCPDHYDEVGRGNLTAEQEQEVLDKLPAFDAETARAARDNGTLVEFLRTYPGSRVNGHVARFVFWGAQATSLMLSQPWDFAFGRDSALERLVDLDGKILLLGSDHDAVTFLHYAEHVLDVPGKIVKRFLVPVSEGGKRVWRMMAEFDTAEAAHASWPERFFARIVDGYLAATGTAAAWVGGAETYLMSARGLLAYALGVMERTARSG